jgi:hypothetical protein
MSPLANGLVRKKRRVTIRTREEEDRRMYLHVWKDVGTFCEFEESTKVFGISSKIDKKIQCKNRNWLRCDDD